MADDSGYPTILIVYEERKFRDVLISKFQQEGYLVLSAQDAAETLEIVIHHSRRIHLMLTDDGDEGRVMVATLKPYRPDMRAMHINSNQEVGLIVREVSKILEPPYESESAQ
jgi:CheY-like chemotaxis protein